jgi:hypothetical protein
VVTVAASPAGRTELSLLQQHAPAFVAGLPCDDQAKRLRRAGAERLLARHPDLQGWMGRPTADRIAEARRLYAWPFLSWCFAIGAIRLRMTRRIPANVATPDSRRRLRWDGPERRMRVVRQRRSRIGSFG